MASSFAKFVEQVANSWYTPLDSRCCLCDQTLSFFPPKQVNPPEPRKILGDSGVRPSRSDLVTFRAGGFD